MSDTTIHFWKCTDEGEFDKLELRRINITDDSMVDFPVKAHEKHAAPSFKIKRKDNYKLAGVVLNKPFIQFSKQK